MWWIFSRGGHLPKAFHPAPEDHFRLDVLDRLRNESRSLRCPDGHSVLVLSEVRKDESRQLDIDALKGDGRITSDADCVLLMYPAQDRPDARANLIPMIIRVEKGRDGVNRADVPVWFDFQHYRFLDEVPSRNGDQGSQDSGSNPSMAQRRGSKSRSKGLDPLAK